MKKGYLNACFFLIYLVLEMPNWTWASNSDWEAFRFPEVAGWKQSVEVQTFSPKTLFEYIDGAADLYLMYDFQELKVAEYSNEEKASITVEIYRHKTPTYAFGIYSQERLSNSKFLDVGVQGYSENDILNFLAGHYYVKLSSFKIRPEDQGILLVFARRLVENLGEKGTLPKILSSFPEEGKVRDSEKFIAIKFLSYGFLHSGFTADYQGSGMKFKLFIIDGADTNDCKEMIQNYLRQTGNPQNPVGEGRYSLRDPHNGDIDLQWKGHYILGVSDVKDSALRSKYLKLLEEGLTKNE